MLARSIIYRYAKFKKRGRPRKRNVAIDSSGLETGRKSLCYIIRTHSNLLKRRDLRKLRITSG